jgi:hypothetical protein
LAVVSSVWASDPAVPPELRGILFTGQDHRFALVGSGAEYSRWASLGETVEGWKLVEYSPADNALVLNRDHQQVTVRLRTSTVGGAGTSTGVQATLANADEVLHKMKFEAMWDRIAAEQKKAIVGAMRQQATAEFAKLGLPPDEIDALLNNRGGLPMDWGMTERIRGGVRGRGLGPLPALPRIERERVREIGRLSGGFVNELERVQRIRAFAARGGRNETLCATSAKILVPAVPGCFHLKRLLRER